jgi:PAS domain S-box-containing protein
MFFVSMFFLTAYISKKKNISAYASEVLLATTGASLLIKMLMQYYYSGLSPVHIIGAILIIVGLSGVFINKSSLMIVALPAFAFIFYTSLFPPEGAAYPIGISYVFLVSASVVGYFLTWQKFFLINKSVAQEVHKNTVISNLHEGVILRDTHGKTLALNQAMCQIMGLTQEELINKSDTDPFWNFLKMDGLTPLAFEDRPHNVARRTGKMVRDFPVIFKRPDHSVVQLELTATPIMSNQDSQQVESVLVTFRDVTELRKAQGVIENQKLHMLAHSKLTSLGEMASGIAHEINNPLTIILGRAGQTQKMIELGKLGNQEIIKNL